MAPNDKSTNQSKDSETVYPNTLKIIPGKEKDFWNLYSKLWIAAEFKQKPHYEDIGDFIKCLEPEHEAIDRDHQKSIIALTDMVYTMVNNPQVNFDIVRLFSKCPIVFVPCISDTNKKEIGDYVITIEHIMNDNGYGEYSIHYNLKRLLYVGAKAAINYNRYLNKEHDKKSFAEFIYYSLTEYFSKIPGQGDREFFKEVEINSMFPNNSRPSHYTMVALAGIIHDYLLYNPPFQTHKKGIIANYHNRYKDSIKEKEDSK